MSKNALVFPGQGSQAVGMGKDLYENFAYIKKLFDEANEILGYDLTKIIFAGDAEELTRTENTQPALMIVSISLMKVLELEFGKKIQDLCDFVAGHSLGEYSALCAANSISFSQAVKLLQIRGKSMAECGKKTAGAMAALIGADIETAEKVVAKTLENQNGDQICQIANDNSVGQIVISGSRQAIEKMVEIAKEFGIKRAIILPVSGAFHSDLMKEAQEKMQSSLMDEKILSPKVNFISNVSANVENDPEKIKLNLINQVTSRVRWRETMICLERNQVSNIIEIGAGKVLSSMVSRTCPNIAARSIQNLSDISNFLNS
jgi:[acyl-carrier-protein] S-malonyltransferase